MSVATYTKTGTKATVAAKLDKSVFAVEIQSHELLKQAYVAYLSNGRNSHATTKTRGLISGGGRKPWKQKGTGRARFGSSRNPIWRGGGIVFGPTGNENHTKKLPTGSKRTAIRQALSIAAKENNIIVIEAFANKDAKVSATADLFKKIGATGNILFVLDTKDLATDRATSNLPNLHVVQAKYLNVYDLLNADTVVMTAPALAMVTEWLANKPAKTAAKDEA